MENIIKQIKFYFSLTNLSKDSTLLLKLQYEKEISIDFLMKFNKLAKLIAEYDDPRSVLMQACSEIPDLILKNDKISLAVPVTNDMIEGYKESSLERTIYIENIPDDSDHSMISSLFSVVGEVVYVSLPRFSESGILKGFGFVEFLEAESVAKSIALLHKKHPKNWNISEPLAILPKQAWLEYKEKFKTLTKRLRVDSPEREYPVLINGIPSNITKTQIEDSLLIKPWKIHYKPASGKALLIYSLESNRKALLRIQPRIYGKIVTYSSP